MEAKAQELTKKQKRARNDARTAWRAMTPAQRGEFLAWAGGEFAAGRTEIIGANGRPRLLYWTP